MLSLDAGCSGGTKKVVPYCFLGLFYKKYRDKRVLNRFGLRFIVELPEVPIFDCLSRHESDVQMEEQSGLRIQGA